MTTPDTLLEAGPSAQSTTQKRVLTVIGWVVAAAIVALVALYAQRGLAPGTPGVNRIANPAVHGAPRPVSYLFGWTHWLGLMQWLTVLQMVSLVGVITWYWRKYPRHPYLLMAIAATAVVWMDPIMNWAPFAVYNPQLWHLPVNWPLASVSPTIEPFIVIGYASFYAGPFFPANGILKRLQARRPGSFAARHPLWSLALLILVIGFVYDAILEIFCIRAGLYMYDQVVPFGSIWNGTPFQFPLLVEPAFVLIMMIPAGLLLYSSPNGEGADGPGRGGVAVTNAERIARRLRVFARRPALGAFVVMFGLLMIAYCGYGGAFAALKDTGSSTSVACPWQYPEAKIYDPQGFYAKTGDCAHPSTGNASHG